MTDDPESILLAAFEGYGLSPGAAAGLAGLVAELADIRARHLVAERFMALRATVAGEGMYRALVGDDGETVEASARRLHTTSRELRDQRARFRAVLGEPPPGG